MSTTGFLPTPTQGRPRAARRRVSGAFSDALEGRRKRTAVLCRLNIDVLSRRRPPFAATALTLGRLREAAARIGFEGELVESTLPVRHSVAERRRLGGLR